MSHDDNPGRSSDYRPVDPLGHDCADGLSSRTLRMVLPPVPPPWWTAPAPATTTAAPPTPTPAPAPAPARLCGRAGGRCNRSGQGGYADGRSDRGSNRADAPEYRNCHGGDGLGQKAAGCRIAFHSATFLSFLRPGVPCCKDWGTGPDQPRERIEGWLHVQRALCSLVPQKNLGRADYLGSFLAQ
jgi:hypothetical protein